VHQHADGHHHFGRRQHLDGCSFGRDRRCIDAHHEVRERGVDDRQDLADVERLDQVGDGTERLDLRRGLLIGERRQKHEGNLAILAQVGRNVEAAHALHADVEQSQIGAVLTREKNRVVAVIRIDHVVAGLRQAMRQRGQHQAVVVDHQDRSFSVRAHPPDCP